MTAASQVTSCGASEMRAPFNAYLRDEFTRHVPENPPGGTTGDIKADARLCTFLYNAKGSADPVAYLRDVGHALMQRSTPASWHMHALRRLAAWLAPDEDDEAITTEESV